MNKFHKIEEALEEIKKGNMVIVVDDEDRENEGDFIMAADVCEAKHINFMATHGRGLICTPITEKQAKKLDLTLMVESNKSLHETAFTQSIDFIGSGTGISAKARALTIKKMMDDDINPRDLLRPGHIFPLIAKEGGVLKRAGHTEAAIDLSVLAGFSPAGVICEIMKEDGDMARRDDLFIIAEDLNLKIITIKDLIEYRRNHDVLIEETSVIDFPNDYGTFKLHLFESKINDGEHHMAFVKGDVNTDEPVLVRVHSECFTGDIFGSKRCDCGLQLESAMKKIEEAGKGVLVYMRQEGRGIGLENKLKAYALQDKGFDTVEANHKLGFKSDLREYGFGAQILKSLGVKKMKLMTNNPKKIVGIEGFELEVTERISIEFEPNKLNKNYLEVKKEKMGHLLTKVAKVEKGIVQ